MTTDWILAFAITAPPTDWPPRWVGGCSGPPIATTLRLWLGPIGRNTHDIRIYRYPERSTMSDIQPLIEDALARLRAAEKAVYDNIGPSPVLVEIRAAAVILGAVNSIESS